MTNVIRIADIERFHDCLLAKNEAITPYAKELDGDPFFLIAATGLGKTVVVPVNALMRAMRRSPHATPKIWVVQPTVLIAQDVLATVNQYWRTFCAEKGITRPPLFGCKTKVDRVNMDAPIIFATTGIFSIFARGKTFRPGIDNVIIDEAHVTLETDHAMELGVALCRRNGTRVDFMSATVDEQCIKEAFPDMRVIRAMPKRHAIWKHATKLKLCDCIVDVVEQTLVNFNPHGPFAPPANHPAGSGVAAALSESNRTKGLLIVVPTYAADDSAAQKVLQKLKAASFANRIDIVLMSGESRRNTEQRAAYDTAKARWIREKSRYVIIATSVAEMGVTFPSLDVVVTTDEGFIEDGLGKTIRGQLGTNSLLQRAGRVGRERPGLLVITKDAGAPYSELSDEELNGPDALAPQPIRFPMRNGRLTQLAYQICSEGWEREDILDRLANLALPSGVERDEERIDNLCDEHANLHRCGAARLGRLTPLGLRLRQWVGRFPLEWAAPIVEAYEQGDYDGLLTSTIEGIMTLYGGKICTIIETDDRPHREAAWAVLTAYSPGVTGPMASQDEQQSLAEAWAEDKLSLSLTKEAGGGMLSAIEDVMELLWETARRERIQSPCEKLLQAYRLRRTVLSQ